MNEQSIDILSREFTSMLSHARSSSNDFGLLSIAARCKADLSLNIDMVGILYKLSYLKF